MVFAMGRFSIGQFIEARLEGIINTFGKAIKVIKGKGAEDNSEAWLQFKSTRYGNILLHLYPKEQRVGIYINPTRIKSPDDCHVIYFENCVRVHLGRTDARDSKLFATFENGSGTILEVNEDGKIYLAKPHPNHWKELGDIFK